MVLCHLDPDSQRDLGSYFLLNSLCRSGVLFLHASGPHLQNGHKTLPYHMNAVKLISQFLIIGDCLNTSEQGYPTLEQPEAAHCMGQSLGVGEAPHPPTASFSLPPPSYPYPPSSAFLPMLQDCAFLRLVVSLFFNLFLQ